MNPAVLTMDELSAQVAAQPRLPLSHLPTPLERLDGFSREIGGPPIWIKRDDCTGLAFGGNKARHNEFIFGYADQIGTDVVVWGAGVQSNNCRQTAATCVRQGWPCHLVLSRSHFKEELQGNLLLDHLLGAHVEIVDAPVGPELDDLIAERADQYRAAGKRAFCWDRDIVKPRAAISYVVCLMEVLEQMAAEGLKPQAVYVCSAGSTGAGLSLARSVLGESFPVRCIAPLTWPWDTQEDMAEEANMAAEILGIQTRLAASDIDVTNDYIGEDYGVSTPGGMAALQQLARSEGILLDPIYSAKAMHALIDDIQQGRLKSDEPVVFVHTGGTPALFAYRDDLARMVAVPDKPGM